MPSSGTLIVYLDSDKKLTLPTWGTSSGRSSEMEVVQATPKCYTSPPSEHLKLPSKVLSLKRTGMQAKGVTIVKRGGERLSASKPDSKEGIVAPVVLVGANSGSEIWDWSKCLDLVFVNKITGVMRFMG